MILYADERMHFSYVRICSVLFVTLFNWRAHYGIHGIESFGENKIVFI